MAYCHTTLCLLSVIVLANANSMDMKAQKNPPVQGSLAETAVLSCHFSTTKSTSSPPTTTPASAKWTKLEGDTEKIVLLAQNGVILTGPGYLGRVSVPANIEDTGDASLTIRQLRASDEGVYHCEVMFGIKDTQANVSLDVSGVVFHYRTGTSRYTLTFEKAKEACQNVGATIATEDQLKSAFEDGFDHCDAGWIADQSVRYPITTPRPGCYGDKQNKPGIRTYGIRDASEMYDVYCYVGKIDGEVFSSHGLPLTLKQAKRYCMSLGSVLASPGQLHAAWREGLHFCDYTWLSDGSVRYAVSFPSYNCGQGTVGVRTLYRFENQTGFPLPFERFRAMCFKGPAFDPCNNYTVLDDPSRVTNNTAVLSKCDRDVNWYGWYRLMYNGQNIRMPEYCMNRGCGAALPLWLNGTHPGLQDGIVTRNICHSCHSGSCPWQPSIQVKACPGNFYVYHLAQPRICNSLYCADVNTISTTESTTPAAVSTPTASINACHKLHCTEDEVCGEVRGIYGCLCKDNHHTPNPESFGLVATCHNSSGWISLSRCLLFEAGFSAQVLHLNNPDCKGTVQDGQVKFHFNNDDQKCGTQLKANETHFIYENSIQGKADSADGHIISRERLLNLQFVCEYPLKQSASMDMAVHALTSITQLNLPPGKGTYQIQMVPYKDADFTQLFSGTVAETSDEKIYISVNVDGVDSQQFSSVLDLCWATPTNNSASSIIWSLITKQCANPEDGTVEVFRNGVSTSSHFSFRMFTFDGHAPQLYLHCSLHLCLLKGNSCAPNCKSGYRQRARRSADMRDPTTVSFGPLSFPSGKTDVVDVLAPQAKRYRLKV